MIKTLKSLALALLNATLILVALCLFLAWKVASTVDGLTATFTQNLEVVTPLKDEIGAVKQEIAATRDTLKTIDPGESLANIQLLEQVQTRLDKLDQRMASAGAAITDLKQAPARLLDHAIEESAAKFGAAVNDIRRCTPAAQSAQLVLPPADLG